MVLWSAYARMPSDTNHLSIFIKLLKIVVMVVIKERPKTTIGALLLD